MAEVFNFCSREYFRHASVGRSDLVKMRVGGRVSFQLILYE